MRISTKCSVALHILVLLEAFKESKLTSEIIAKSTGCNPVVVRNLLGVMKNAGIIDVRRGVGGSSLLMKPADITVWTVFKAVDSAQLEELIGLHPSPSQKCPVGKNIYALLEGPYSVVANSIEEAMRTCTLEQILDNYNNLNQSDSRKIHE